MIIRSSFLLVIPLLRIRAIQRSGEWGGGVGSYSSMTVHSKAVSPNQRPLIPAAQPRSQSKTAANQIDARKPAGEATEPQTKQTLMHWSRYKSNVKIYAAYMRLCSKQMLI